MKDFRLANHEPTRSGQTWKIENAHLGYGLYYYITILLYYIYNIIIESFASAPSPRASIALYSWTRSSRLIRARTDLSFYRQNGKIQASDWFPTKKWVGPRSRDPDEPMGWLGFGRSGGGNGQLVVGRGSLQYNYGKNLCLEIPVYLHNWSTTQE